MKTEAHCWTCLGVGRYIDDVTHRELQCDQCLGTGLNGEEGCFICGESFEPWCNLRLIRGHLIHENCINKPWPSDGLPPVVEREL